MEWEIAASDTSCAACGRGFADRDEYYSALRQEGEGFERKDYCPGCWEPGDDVFSFWKTRARLEPEPPKRFVSDEVILDFFDRLSQSSQATRRKVFFITAVLLLRKRLLREKGRKREGGAVKWVLWCPALEKSYEVEDAGVGGEEISEVLSEIGRVLNIRLTEPAEDESPADPG
ncbi:MAG: hypothetical protein ACYTAN_05465 [Planctomycetota bacterium]|jgi:hypothetical protein